MAKGGGWEVGGTTLQVGIVAIGALAVYAIYKSFKGGEQVGGWLGGQAEGLEAWLAGGANRAVGAPQYYWGRFWHETTGQGGLGWTNKPEDERSFWLKDPDSTLWGWGWQTEPAGGSGTGNPNWQKRKQEASQKSYWKGEEGLIPDWIY
jgi:hypothetical protein